ncbi:hypothetical protein CAL26_04315 [Bordetella genomosp. 9]|uniref:Uncharacterized protein n=1 Tax=Bordetella genomosp. 9 TaxID=1416803 RepID=A0A261RNK9_9BORD|nr:hypothetical protein [Bordetella genomosp. 9]OZI26555.1 hypothetical protein CAL26_04315 [Bordetella genomosp. 9]
MYAQTAGVTAHAASGFRSEFFLPFRSNPDAPPSDAAPGDTGLSYSRELHGSNRAFCASPVFPRYREEMRVLLDILTAFAVDDGMPAATRTAIADGFNQLYQRRFDTPYVEQYAELIDGPGKRTLESICALVHDDSIPLALRRATACNLSTSLSVCQGGTLSNLLLAQRTLMTSAGGMRARLWKIKDECARALLLEAVHEKFHTRKEYLTAELHYVNSAWNHLAGEFGLQPMNDPGADALLAGDSAFLDLCRARLLAGLTPENLATRLAEDCLGAFVGSAPEGARGAPYGTGIPAWFDSALEAILLDLRLGADRLTLHAFVQLDDSGQRYRLRTDATLVAVALLDAIHAEGLMDHMPQYGGMWVDQDGQRAAMLVHGALAWRATAMGRGEPRPVWNAAESAAELLTVDDLRRWTHAYEPFGGDVPAILVRAAIRADEPEALAATPAAWLMDADTALQLLARMDDERGDGRDDERANRYLETHVSHFLARFPRDQRAAFIDGAMHRGPAAGLLACSWYADMYALLSETAVAGGPTRLQRWMTLRNAAAIDAARDLADNGWGGATCPPRKATQLAALMRGNKQTPILYEAMARGDAAGIGAWGQLLCSSVILPNIGTMLTDLLVADRQGGISALCEAMHKDRAASVAAFGAMLADARLLTELPTQLPTLLAGTGSRFRRTPHRANALMYGMDGGAVAAIEAYGELLVHPALLPRIGKDIPKLFGISGSRGTRRRGSARGYCRAPLWWAMNNGHAGAVCAFQRILTQPAVMACMKPHLPNVLAGCDPAGRVTALHAALRKDCAAAIDAYHAFLAHPDVTPHLRAALPELLRAEDSWGSPGLAVAASRGSARAIAAYHAILVDDAIWPTIRASLPGLLKARPLGEANGLAQALGAGHADVLKAYHGMLVDRKILPEIPHVLAALLIKRGVSGMNGMPLAVRGGHQDAIDAFRAILVDSRIEPHIGKAGQADQWQAFHLGGRAPRGGLLDRIVFWLQSWMV